jgi:hypothetical protein
MAENCHFLALARVAADASPALLSDILSDPGLKLERTPAHAGEQRGEFV